jgi:hypothetical protein
MTQLLIEGIAIKAKVRSKYRFMTNDCDYDYEGYTLISFSTLT